MPRASHRSSRAHVVLEWVTPRPPEARRKRTGRRGHSPTPPSAVSGNAARRQYPAIRSRSDAWCDAPAGTFTFVIHGPAPACRREPRNLLSGCGEATAGPAAFCGSPFGPPASPVFALASGLAAGSHPLRGCARHDEPLYGGCTRYPVRRSPSDRPGSPRLPTWR
jgi:hypothetical protein